MKTAIVILSYNGKHFLERYLDILISNSKNCEIIIADNASTDGTTEWVKERHKEIRLIQHNKNWGFADGYNMALKEVKSEYYLLLNSDIRTEPGWIEPLENWMDTHPGCAACQPKVLSENDHTLFEYAGAAGGYIDRYGYPFCRGRIFSAIEKDNGQYNSVKEIFWATGAALMIRSKCFWDAGGLDGRFFAHQEEIDLCWRLKSRGWSIVCVPQSRIFHIGGGTLGYESPFKTQLNFRNNAILLYKNVTSARYWALYPLRIVLDITASVQMALQGKHRNALSVIKANIEFLKTRKNFKNDRMTNKKLASTQKPYGILNHLLLAEVYIKGRTKFSQYKDFE